MFDMAVEQRWLGRINRYYMRLARLQAIGGPWAKWQAAQLFSTRKIFPPVRGTSAEDAFLGHVKSFSFYEQG